MLASSRVRYAVVESDGKKKVFEHPYRPWQSVAPEHEKGANSAYLAFRAYENCREWLVLTLPCLWLFYLFFGAAPYVTDAAVEGLTFGLGAVYVVGNELFHSGYRGSADGRITGFKIRTVAFRGLAYGCLIGIVCVGLERLGFDLDVMVGRSPKSTSAAGWR
jgi:hypothetical protein